MLVCVNAILISNILHVMRPGYLIVVKNYEGQVQASSLEDAVFT